LPLRFEALRFVVFFAFDFLTALRFFAIVVREIILAQSTHPREK
jgi:hypothetical protein